MAKALGTIITLIGAVVVNVVPGLGQVASAAILIGSAAAGALITSLLTPAAKPDTTVSSQKQAIPPRVRATGRSRLHGYYALYMTAANGSTTDVYAFADNSADAIEQIYLNDDKVTTVGNYVQATVDKKYQGNKVIAATTKGEVPGSYFNDVGLLIPGWTSDHRGDGIVTGYLIKAPENEKHFTETYPQGDNVEMSIVARWGHYYDPRDATQNVNDDPSKPEMWNGNNYIGSWKWTENAVLHFLWFLVWDRGYSYDARILPAVSYWKAAADVCDEPVPTTGETATITVAAAAGATSLTLSETTGLTNGTSLTIEGGIYAVTGINGNVVTISPGLAYAEAVGQGVSWLSNGAEPRYRSCVTYQATSAEKDIVASFLQTFDGWIQERGDGAFVVYAGKVYTPTVSIGSDEIISYNWQGFVETENGIDQVKVTYISADHDYTEQECTPWGGENGATRIGTLDAATPSFSQNRRLAKRLMDRTNSANRGTLTTTLEGRKIRGERYINFDLSENDFSLFSGVVEVTKLTRNFESGGLDIEWIAIDPNIDAWNPDTEEGSPAPAGNVVAVEALEPPTVQGAELIYDASGQDSTGTRISATVTSPLGSRTDLTWYLRWKRHESTVWNEKQYQDVDPSDAVVLVTDFVPTDTAIDIEAEYKSGDGRLSEWSETYPIDTSTDTVAPDNAVSITQTNWSDSLDLVTDYIARARNYRWRFYASDGTTLVRTIITSNRTVSYTSAQAATDGARRAYIVKVAGVNGAGAGSEATTGTLTLTAPPAVTGISATGGATNAEVDFDLQNTANTAGYSVAYSTASGFDPLTQGTIQRSLSSPTYLQGLAAATFYTKVAAFDAWTDRPDLLNYSSEASFAITTGGGGTGGGGGDGGGGYCPTEDEPILMANAAHDGPGDQVPAGTVKAGDWVWTQHETTMQWGAYQVEAAELATSEDVWLAMGFKATGGHRTWLSSVWNRHDTLGYKLKGTYNVVKITVQDAHTYVCAGILSHNIKQGTQDDF